MTPGDRLLQSHAVKTPQKEGETTMDDHLPLPGKSGGMAWPQPTAAAAGNLHPSWTPPETLDEADDLIGGLTGDINFILTQLAESREAWCRRTGRTEIDYEDWRRRAMLAKLRKEAQLRDVKRARRRLKVDRRMPVGNVAIVDRALRALSRRVLRHWDQSVLDPRDHPLGRALSELEDYLRGTDRAVTDVEMVGSSVAEHAVT